MNRMRIASAAAGLLMAGGTAFAQDCQNGQSFAFVRLFNMPASDYKKFLNFLRKHDCQLPFKEFRQ